jgi:DNA-directed RNA polymerase subunit RPC12/RpoP
MIISIEYELTQYYRTSKLGKHHVYSRKKSMVVLRCDKCSTIFKREKGSMSPQRLTNEVYHVCENCDTKRFAQEKGVERRKIWDMPVSSLKTLGHL